MYLGGSDLPSSTFLQFVTPPATDRQTDRTPEAPGMAGRHSHRPRSVGIFNPPKNWRRLQRGGAKGRRDLEHTTAAAAGAGLQGAGALQKGREREVDGGGTALPFSIQRNMRCNVPCGHLLP